MTPASRVAGRAVTTLAGLPEADGWCRSFAAHGASQCGFCTPGIIVRVATLAPAARATTSAVDRALAAHLCRCTGWQPIRDAVLHGPIGPDEPIAQRSTEAAARRAALEGGVPQRVGPDVAAGAGGFADDTAPADALVAVLGATGDWVVAETLTEARRRAGKVQGRRSTAAVTWPLEVPDGDWARTLRTTWVEPGYLEPDASWCRPGG